MEKESDQNAKTSISAKTGTIELVERIDFVGVKPAHPVAARTMEAIRALKFSSVSEDRIFMIINHALKYFGKEINANPIVSLSRE